ncbi:MAG: hypothetical protein VX641_02220 [Planctomycetota bacterium]|nr:hypothetical protein [Planctomycetota bacterium]
MSSPIVHILIVLAALLTGMVQDQEPASDSDARALLERMERAHQAVEVFVSPLTYRKEYGLEGDFETRIGVVAMKGEGAQREMTLVFDRIIDASGHGTDQPEFHMFRNGWWTELDPRRKRYVRRQIIEPDSSSDPFELGEGPLPLPLKQRADTVLDRFDVSIGRIPDEPLFQSITEAEVLHLVPRPGTPAAEDHESIDLLFETTTLLPIGIRLSHRNGDRTTAWLRKPSAQANDEVTEARLKQFESLIAATRTESGWRIESKPLPGPEVDEGAQE